MSVEEIVNIKPQLGMIFVPYCHEESKSSDNEYDFRIDRVKVAELIEHINQYMTLHASSFEVANDMINIDAMTKLIIVGIQAYPYSQIFLEIFNKYGCYQQINDARLQDWVEERNMKVAFVCGWGEETYM